MNYVLFIDTAKYTDDVITNQLRPRPASRSRFVALWALSCFGLRESAAKLTLEVGQCYKRRLA